MRLLKCGPSAYAKELDLELCEHLSPDEVTYAILSHRWGPAKDEVSYQDFISGLAKQKKEYEKIEGCCRQALRDGYYYVWIDTCCIDKTSSAELSEAVNSMYRWYAKSAICYAYLNDVEGNEEVINKPGSTFRSSRWFTRGWTLQELIAPKEVLFLAPGWECVGRKTEIAEFLEDVTRVGRDILIDPEGYLPQVCISQIMYWASGRQTARIEDRAYSLIGLFNISLPIIYGEGNRAFQRLQEEIMRLSFDHSIFAWHLTKPCSGPLAESPDAFAKSGEVRSMPPRDYETRYKGFIPHRLDYSMKSLGLKIQLPLFKVPHHPGLYYALIACTFFDRGSRPIFVYLRESCEGASNQFFRTRTSSESFDTLEFHINIIYDELLELRTLWVMRPDINLRRKVRQLPPEPLFKRKKMIGYTADKVKMDGSDVFHMKIDYCGPKDYKIESAYPLPNVVNSNLSDDVQLITETEPGIVWTALINFNHRLPKLLVMLVVIDNETVVHLQQFEESEVSSSNFVRFSEMFYEKCKQSSARPCSLIFRSKSLTDIEAVEVSVDTVNADIDVNRSSAETANGLHYLYVNDITYTRKWFNVCVLLKRLCVNPQNMERLQEKLEDMKRGKSLKDLLAKSKHISAHLHEDSYDN